MKSKANAGRNSIAGALLCLRVILSLKAGRSMSGSLGTVRLTYGHHPWGKGSA